MIAQYKISTKRLGLINRYYKITKFYSFLKDTAFKGGILIVIFVLLLLGVQYFIMDINELLISMVEMFSPIVLFSIFLISESVLGLIPPEVFIGWAAKSQSPWFFLFILATMSYIGGSVAYFIGNRMLLIPAVNRHIETKIARHISNLRKWGGLFVFIGAMLPIPYSIVSLACGLIKYNYKYFLFWALFRYARFVIYALVIFKIF